MGEKIKQVHFVGSFFLLFYAYSYQKYSAGHAIVKVKMSQCFLAHLYYTRTPGERNSKIAKIVKTPYINTTYYYQVPSRCFLMLEFGTKFPWKQNPYHN